MDIITWSTFLQRLTSVPHSGLKLFHCCLPPLDHSLYCFEESLCRQVAEHSRSEETAGAVCGLLYCFFSFNFQHVSPHGTTNQTESKTSKRCLFYSFKKL